jgi:hypothetical protein
MTYTERNGYRAEVIDLIVAQKYEFHITARFNKGFGLRLEKAQRILKYVDAEVDRVLLRHHWAKLPDHLRTRFIAFPEGRTYGFRRDSLWEGHYHVLLSLPTQCRLSLDANGLGSLVAAIWKKYTGTDDVNAKAIWDPQGAASYVTKLLPESNLISMDWFVIAPMSVPRKHNDRAA